MAVDNLCSSSYIKVSPEELVMSLAFQIEIVIKL